MTGRELLAALRSLPESDLDLPVVYEAVETAGHYAPRIDPTRPVTDITYYDSERGERLTGQVLFLGLL